MVWPTLTELRELGLDAAAIVTSVGLSLKELDDPDTRFPYETFVALGQAAIAATGDEAFGLHLAEHYRPGVFGLLDYLAHSSKTLGEAYHHLCRYNRLLHDVAETHVDIEGNRAIVWQETLGGVRRP
ncbi:MAG TPA: AraC family transcriptional regulator ligand-binding domain-containing protein, partial [Polyangiaceae bacterium]|nr:AraC family transcriptional regulator ligand-binding domain-containing protein [Polyangiaceae bacterium]